jgi:hypothetical protein
MKKFVALVQSKAVIGGCYLLRNMGRHDGSSLEGQQYLEFSTTVCGMAVYCRLQIHFNDGELEIGSTWVHIIQEIVL